MPSGWKNTIVCWGLTVGGCLIFWVVCFGIIMPILQISFGATYRDQCPINPNIPIYLIVAGIDHIVVSVVLLFTIGGLACSMVHETVASFGIAICCGCMSIVLIIISSIFSFIWLVVGSVWIFGAKTTVQHDKPELNTYCHGTLYNFAFVIVIIECALLVLRFTQQSVHLNTNEEGVASRDPPIPIPIDSDSDS